MFVYFKMILKDTIVSRVKSRAAWGEVSPVYLFVLCHSSDIRLIGN